MSKTNYLKVTTPWAIEVPRKTMAPKKYSMNLNTYRNLQGFVNNNLKVLFKDLMKSQLDGVVLKTPVEVTIQVYKPTQRILDKGNVYGMSAKYLYDAMTEYGCWEDDNDNFVKTETLLPTKYDKGNGRIEFEFKTVGE